VSSYGFFGLAVLVSQLLEGLFTEDVFLKQFCLLSIGPVLSNKPGTTFLAKKDLYAVGGFPVFYYSLGAAMLALFLDIRKRIDGLMPERKL